MQKSVPFCKDYANSLLESILEGLQAGSYSTQLA